jgi:hypothetical protein
VNVVTVYLMYSAEMLARVSNGGSPRNGRCPTAMTCVVDVQFGRTGITEQSSDGGIELRTADHRRIDHDLVGIKGPWVESE